jgi:hypothetical protein
MRVTKLRSEHRSTNKQFQQLTQRIIHDVNNLKNALQLRGQKSDETLSIASDITSITVARTAYASIRDDAKKTLKQDVLKDVPPSSSHFSDHDIDAYLQQLDDCYDAERQWLQNGFTTLFSEEDLRAQYDDFASFSRDQRDLLAQQLQATTCTISIAANAIMAAQNHVKLRRTEYVLKNQEAAQKRRRNQAKILSSDDKDV